MREKIVFLLIVGFSLGFEIKISSKKHKNEERISWKDTIIESESPSEEYTSVNNRGKILLGTARCGIEDDRQGLCYGEITCKRLKGKINGYCSGLDGACCVFYRTCGGRTSQEISHFRNEEWPQEGRLKETCSFSVKKRDAKICGLQIDLEKLNLPGYVGKCTDTFMWITGVPRQRIELICGDFSGASYYLNITATTEMFIKIKSYSGYRSSWSVIVKQIACSDFKFEKFPEKGEGNKSSLVVPVTEAIVDPVVDPTTEAPSKKVSLSTILVEPVANFSECGIRGSPRDLGNSKLKKASFFDDSEGIVDNVTTTDVKWMVPVLSDSKFYMYQGSTGLLGQRITYGQIAGEMEFPWQVAIFTGISFHCGGSIIGSYYILTAAHCVWSYRNKPSSLRIVLGKYDISKSYEEDERDIYVKTVLPHPNYVRQTLENDVAVLKLTKEIIFSDRARPICLPSPELNPEGELAVVTGWGRDEHYHLVSKLHKLQSAIIDNKVCDDRWIDKGTESGFIEPSMVCMDVQDGDSCNGDSGGPSAIEYPPDSRKYMQIGIVSFGSGSCTDKHLPGVYTRVPFFVNWIKNQMQ